MSEGEPPSKNIGSFGRNDAAVGKIGWVESLNESEVPIVENSKSIIKKHIPPVPADLKPGCVTLVLFYQYMEPCWTNKRHKQVIKKCLELGRKFQVNGRGRCAPEGLNCTLTGPAAGIRAFCQGLRDYDPIFNNTDFKFTDDLPYTQRFKALSIRKCGELVAYGLEGEVAPSLVNGGQHLEAPDYHAMLVDKKGPPTVVIDVRNAYESAIGHFQPPPGGAQLLDPKMRNSNDFPYWLNLPETKEKLQGKRVMMYCTGGIRCERATALLNEITATDSSFHTKGVYELRGGIDRYLKTFPEGGVWKGKNYVFDRRRSQAAEKKSAKLLEQEVESRCSYCRNLWDEYRGKIKCSGAVAEGSTTAGSKLCKVPVILCISCLKNPNVDKSKLLCELCREGYVAPLARVKIDLKKQRKAVIQQGGAVVDKKIVMINTTKRPIAAISDEKVLKDSDNETREAEDDDLAVQSALKKKRINEKTSKKDKHKKNKKNKKKHKRQTSDKKQRIIEGDEKASKSSNNDSKTTVTPYPVRQGDSNLVQNSCVNGRRLFVGKLPFVITAAKVREALNAVMHDTKATVELIHWKRDNDNGLFYGAAFVLISSVEGAKQVVVRAKSQHGITLSQNTSSHTREVANNKKKKKRKVSKVRRLKINLAPLRKDEVWPPKGFTEEETPPII